jgi:hypothetical protein
MRIEKTKKNPFREYAIIVPADQMVKGKNRTGRDHGSPAGASNRDISMCRYDRT